MARENARTAGVQVNFQLGNASAMPFPDASFDFVYCSAAFKNFTEPVKALDEMHRVLRPGGEAVIVDLCKDTPPAEIDRYIDQSERSPLDRWLTRMVFRHMLLKRAYRRGDFTRMAEESHFGRCTLNAGSIGLEVWFTKPQVASAGVWLNSLCDV